MNVDYLYSAVMSTLKMAEKLECASVAIPAISSGIFGFPKPLCAQTFFNAIEKFCEDSPEGMCLKDVRLTNFDQETTGIFYDEFEKVFGELVEPADEELDVKKAVVVSANEGEQET